MKTLKNYVYHLIIFISDKQLINFCGYQYITYMIFTAKCVWSLQIDHSFLEYLLGKCSTEKFEKTHEVVSLRCQGEYLHTDIYPNKVNDNIILYFLKSAGNPLSFS